MEPKIRFKVSGRLSVKDKFQELSVNSKFWELDNAQVRMQEWLTAMTDLPKAKPEANIEVEELPHLADCKDCSCALFLDDLVYYAMTGISCASCAETEPFGFFDCLDYPKNSLDKLSGI